MAAEPKLEDYQVNYLEHIQLLQEEAARKALLPKEYQVVYLDETKKLCQLDNTPPVMESNNLGEAMMAAKYIWESEGVEVGVWQPRTQGFRDYYKHSNLPKRDAKGRFIKS